MLSGHTGPARHWFWPVSSAAPILILLIITAVLSAFLGDAGNTVVVGVILLGSVLLGSSSEFRAERAAEALHSRVKHEVVALRDGARSLIQVVDLVPGDVVLLTLGAVMPADIRLLSCEDLMCDESILTGESQGWSWPPARVPSSEG